MDLIRELTDQGDEVGMTKDGQFVINHQATIVINALEKSENFLIGFEDDPEQTAAIAALAAVRAALVSLRSAQS